MKRKVDNVKVVCEELQQKKINKKWKSRKNRKNEK